LAGVRLRAGEVRLVVVVDFFAAAAVRWGVDFRAGEPLDFFAAGLLLLDFRAGEPVDFFAAGRLLLELDFLAGVLDDFFAADPLELAFLVGDPLEPVDFRALELLELDLEGPLELDFFAVEPFELADFFAVDPLELADFFAVDPFELDFLAVEPFPLDFFAPELLLDPDPLPDDFRRRWTLPSWISPPQPSMSSWFSSAWLATCRRKCLSSSRTRRPWARQMLPVRSNSPCGWYSRDTSTRVRSGASSWNVTAPSTLPFSASDFHTIRSGGTWSTILAVQVRWDQKICAFQVTTSGSFWLTASTFFMNDGNSSNCVHSS
jgi:hypothetical protein